MVDRLQTHARKPPKTSKIIRESNYLKRLKCIKLEEHSKDLVVLLNEYNIFHYQNTDSDKNIFSVLCQILIYL